MTFTPVAKERPTRILAPPDGTAVFHVKSGRVVIENLTIVEAGIGIMLTDRDENVVRNMRFQNDTTPPFYLVYATAGAVVTSNFFDRTVASALCLWGGCATHIPFAGGTAITVQGAITVITMNIIRGAFAAGVFVTGGAFVAVDNNTVALERGLSNESVAFHFDNVNLCFHNNAVLAAGPQATPSWPPMAFHVDATTVDDSALAAGAGAAGNVIASEVERCAGSACVLCPPGGSGPLCNAFVEASEESADSALCPAPGAALVDHGTDVGLDMVDDRNERFFGSAPESGARETGSARIYGDVISTCPAT
jgi:hypothetical protein